MQYGPHHTEREAENLNTEDPINPNFEFESRRLNRI